MVTCLRDKVRASAREERVFFSYAFSHHWDSITINQFYQPGASAFLVPTCLSVASNKRKRETFPHFQLSCQYPSPLLSNERTAHCYRSTDTSMSLSLSLSFPCQYTHSSAFLLRFPILSRTNFVTAPVFFSVLYKLFLGKQATE